MQVQTITNVQRLLQTKVMVLVAKVVSVVGLVLL